MDTDSAAQAAGIKAIEQVVATVEHSQQHKDPDEFLSLFHRDAVWTTAHGKVLIGLYAISEFTRRVLPAAHWDGRVTYEVAHVLFIRPTSRRSRSVSAICPRVTGARAPRCT